jgi:hypothetical protein
MSNVRRSASENAEHDSEEIVKVRLYRARLNCCPTTRVAVHFHPQAHQE